MDSVKFIVCEDTRQTKQLLFRQNIWKDQKLICGNEYRQEQIVPYISQLLDSGASIAYVTDAGTPGVSDPGPLCVGLIRGRGYPVVCVPGPSSITALLSVLSQYYAEWSFIGFFPRKDGQRQELFASWLQTGGVFIGLESPKRILELLASAIMQYKGKSVHIHVAKELTKLHERLWEGPLENVYESLLANQDSIKGEFIICFSVTKDHKEYQWQKIAKIMVAQVGTKQTAKMIAECFDLKVSDVYQEIIDKNE